MWLWLAIGSAFLLGFYDVAKKKASYANSVLNVLLYATGIATVCFIPLILSSLFGWGLGDGTPLQMMKGTPKDHLLLILKSLIVTSSWISGLIGLKHLPITTAGTIKASRPVFVLLGSVLIFAERPNALQWTGILIAIFALYLLGRSSKKEGIDFSKNKWIFWMFFAVFSGVASALLDKKMMTWMTPMFTQSWCNFYITVILALMTMVLAATHSEFYSKFHWDWNIFLIALFLTVSDFLYFYSLSVPGSMLSVISMIRRSSVIITFICGAIFFKEGRLKEKGVALIVLLAAMAILVFGSR